MNTALPFEWTSVFDKSLEICHEDEQYPVYSVREKMLAFIFTFLQSLNQDEEKYTALFKSRSILFDRTLDELKLSCMRYCDALITEGTNSGEIQARPFIANAYKNILWNGFVAVLYFWSKDTSANKEHTDVIVEKTVHFVFDLLATNPVDSGIDLVQNFLKLRK